MRVSKVSRKGDYYSYNGFSMVNMFFHFMNRVLTPMVHLKTLDEVSRFLEIDKEWKESTNFYKNKYESIQEVYDKLGKHVRVIGFFHDKKEYSTEYKLF